MNIQRSGPRVLLLNNYEMDEAYDEWKAGLCPSHHLWGAADLGVHGIDLKILPFEKFRALNRYWRAQRLLGLQSTGMIALDQQIRCLVDTKSEVIYSACQYHSFLLARLRRLGILRKPLIATLHHPFAPGGKEEQLLRGHDLLLCLSSKVRQQALDRGAVDQHKIRIIEWGPDLDFFGPFRPYDSMHIGNIPLLIGAGKSARDYDTVVEAVRDSACRLDIYCSGSSRPTVAHSSERLRIFSGDRDGRAVGHVELREAYFEAYAIVIPMPSLNRLAGLTSLLDAMAIGRPVIMTRNDYIDIDIEGEGFGFWVDPGDVAGWRSAIDSLLVNPRLALAMGSRARQLAEERFNTCRFTSQVADALRSVSVGGSTRPHRQ